MFYIRNCLGEIVGNPNGYRTMRGATRLCSSPKVKGSLYDELWETYQLSSMFDSTMCTVWSVNARPQGDSVKFSMDAS